jgi:hypothetical protein
VPRRSTRARIALAAFFLAALTSFRPYPRSPEAQAPSQIPLAHSHNDYARKNPLDDALAHGFESVEADLHLVNGRILVSHIGIRYAGSLADLYLKPLQERVIRRGSVHGDGRPFYLWLDIKERRPEIVAALQVVLERYPMLTRIGPEGVTEGPVTAILTGSRNAKQAYGKLDVRHAFHDSWSFSPDDPAVAGPADPWRWYALNWFSYVRWDGEGPIPEGERARLRELVQGIHAKGRRLRFWGAPETPGVWSESTAAGVDLIGTDDVPGLRAYLGSGLGDRRPAGAGLALARQPDQAGEALGEQGNRGREEPAAPGLIDGQAELGDRGDAGQVQPAPR